MNFPRVFAQAAIIILVASAIALAVNGMRSGGIPVFASERAKPSQDEGPMRPVDLAEAKRLYDSGAIFIDARSDAEFKGGHIKDALHLYYADFDARGESVMKPIPLEKTIVTYCSGEDCNSSRILAQRIVEMGYDSVRVFFAGWPAWKAAGYPEVASQTPPALYGSMGIK